MSLRTDLQWDSVVICSTAIETFEVSGLLPYAPMLTLILLLMITIVLVSR